MASPLGKSQDPYIAKIDLITKQFDELTVAEDQKSSQEKVKQVLKSIKDLTEDLARNVVFSTVDWHFDLGAVKYGEEVAKLIQEKFKNVLDPGDLKELKEDLRRFSSQEVLIRQRSGIEKSSDEKEFASSKGNVKNFKNVDIFQNLGSEAAHKLLKKFNNKPGSYLVRRLDPRDANDSVMLKEKGQKQCENAVVITYVNPNNRRVGDILLLLEKSKYRQPLVKKQYDSISHYLNENPDKFKHLVHQTLKPPFEPPPSVPSQQSAAPPPSYDESLEKIEPSVAQQPPSYSTAAASPQPDNLPPPMYEEDEEIPPPPDDPNK